jgi:hypothetical protein
MRGLAVTLALSAGCYHGGSTANTEPREPTHEQVLEARNGMSSDVGNPTDTSGTDQVTDRGNATTTTPSPQPCYVRSSDGTMRAVDCSAPEGTALER